MASLKDVAKLAGVSVATASRVLNDSATVSDEKRESVLSAIQKLDYRPNLAASSLRAKDSKIIGLLIPGRTHITFGMNTSYIADACNESGYSLLIALHHDDPELESKMLDSFFRRNIDGIIISTNSEESTILKQIESYHIPVVVIDRVLQSDKFNCASIDNYKAGYMAGSYLASLGHKRIGCLTKPLTIWQCYQRVQGFKQALKDNNVDVVDRYIVEVPDFSFEAGVLGTEKLLRCEAGDMPTALWAVEDTIAAGAIRAIVSAGFRVPRDISVMGMDNLDVSHYLSPSLTTITYPFRQISNVAVQCILDHCTNQNTRTRQFVFAPELVIRQSTAAPRE